MSVKRNLRVDREPSVELVNAIGIAHDREQVDDEHGQREHLGRPHPRPRQAQVDHEQREAHEQMADGGVGRDAAGSSGSLQLRGK